MSYDIYDIDRIRECMEQKHISEVRRYIENPKDFPSYRREWLSFIEKRTQNIISIGGDCSSYDYQKEFDQFWGNRLQEVMRNVWANKQRRLKRLLKHKRKYKFESVDALVRHVSRSANYYSGERSASVSSASSSAHSSRVGKEQSKLKQFKREFARSNHDESDDSSDGLLSSSLSCTILNSRTIKKSKKGDLTVINRESVDGDTTLIKSAFKKKSRHERYSRASSASSSGSLNSASLPLKFESSSKSATRQGRGSKKKHSEKRSRSSERRNSKHNNYNHTNSRNMPRSRSRSPSRKKVKITSSYDHRNSKSRQTDHMKSYSKFGEVRSDSRKSRSNSRRSRSNSRSNSRRSRSNSNRLCSYSRRSRSNERTLPSHSRMSPSKCNSKVLRRSSSRRSRSRSNSRTLPSHSRMSPSKYKELSINCKTFSNSRRSRSGSDCRSRPNSLTESRMSRSISRNSGSHSMDNDQKDISVDSKAGQTNFSNFVFDISSKEDTSKRTAEQEIRQPSLQSSEDKTKEDKEKCKKQAFDAISNLVDEKLKEINSAVDIDNDKDWEEVNPALSVNKDKDLEDLTSDLRINGDRNVEEINSFSSGNRDEEINRNQFASPFKNCSSNESNISSKLQIPLDELMNTLTQSPKKDSNEPSEGQKVFEINKEIVYIKELLFLMDSVKNDLGIFYYIYSSLCKKFVDVPLDQDVSLLHTNDVLVGLRLIQDQLKVDVSSNFKDEDKTRTKLKIISKVNDILSFMRSPRQELNCPSFLYGLNVADLANSIRDMPGDEAKTFISFALVYEGLTNVTPVQVDEIYLTVHKFLEMNFDEET